MMMASSEKQTEKDDNVTSMLNRMRTMASSQEQIKKFKSFSFLIRTSENANAFPVKSKKFYEKGKRLLKAGCVDEALDKFKRGAESGCLPCIDNYIRGHMKFREEMIYLRLPWILEGAIRGHAPCMLILNHDAYEETKPAPVRSLSNYWMKITELLYPLIFITPKEERSTGRKKFASLCCICMKGDSEDGDHTWGSGDLNKCGACKYYSYCGKECQLLHWKEGKHMGECRQLKILNEYHKPHAEAIRDAIIRGDDPKGIPELQELRTQLGLTRPKEDYEEIILQLGDNDNENNSEYELSVPNDWKMHNGNNDDHRIAARKDGTVHIGSTPEVI
jgi:hypothetical protein